MNSTLAPVATLQADSARAAEEDRPAASALAATVRMVVDARGLTLGVLAALAFIFALSWAWAAAHIRRKASALALSPCSSAISTSSPTQGPTTQPRGRWKCA